MLIVCPNCATSYQVGAKSLGPTGRSVRCVRCQTVWFAQSPDDEAEESPAASLGVPAAKEGLAPAEQAPATPPDAADRHSPPSAPVPPFVQPSLPEFSLELTPAQAGDFTVPFTTPAMPAPVELDEAPSIVPPADHDGGGSAQGPASEPPEDIETFAARRERPKKKPKRAWPALPAIPTMPMLIAVLIGLVVVLVGFRENVVRIAPQTASLYAFLRMPVNLRGVVFADVKTSRDTFEGVPVLVIEGALVNVAGKPVELPRLRYSVRNAAGAEIYSWTNVPPRPVLNSGESVPFKSRLASPPSDSRDILVRFLGRYDSVAGLQ